MPGHLKFVLIKEGKIPADRRVVLSPAAMQKAIQEYPSATFKVESSNIRIFKDDQYRQIGAEVSKDVTDGDIFLGVKEVPIAQLIPSKSYFFFSHTIKEQPYNRELLKAVLQKKINLYDHETITNSQQARLIGFGRYAGLVGTYNCFRMLGQKENKFQLPKAESLQDLKEMLATLDKIPVPPYKFLLTGNGKVARGSREILEHLKIKEVSVESYLGSTFKEPVFCNIDVLDYNRRKDGQPGSMAEFFEQPEFYISDFWRFAVSSHVFIAGHFYGQGAPKFFTKEEAKLPNFGIRYIADISCDINGPIPSTIRSSTIAEPFYGYHRQTGKETYFKDKNAIAVMAVDNLPCELPKDASEGFGGMFLEQVMPAFFNNDKDGILKRAQITKNGKLTENFHYLEDYVNQ